MRGSGKFAFFVKWFFPLALNSYKTHQTPLFENFFLVLFSFLLPFLWFLDKSLAMCSTIHDYIFKIIRSRHALRSSNSFVGLSRMFFLITISGTYNGLGAFVLNL